MSRNFRDLLEKQWESGKFLCVGLDPDIERIPEAMRQEGTRETLVAFNRAIVDATKDIACAYKPNIAFYEAHGDHGWNALREIISYINEVAPQIAVILDAKRADIGNTSEQYAISAFDHLHADAITVNPYMGSDAIAPFLARKDKGVIVLCHTSNPGASEIQNLDVAGEPLYKLVARLAATSWSSNGNCAVMVGATYPEELKEVRAVVGDMPILIAGIGAQRGSISETMEAGLDSRKKGLIVNASRSIIFASNGSDFAEAARREAQAIDGAMREAL